MEDDVTDFGAAGAGAEPRGAHGQDVTMWLVCNSMCIGAVWCQAAGTAPRKDVLMLDRGKRDLPRSHDTSWTRQPSLDNILLNVGV